MPVYRPQIRTGLEAQLRDLEAAGCEKTFSEKVSGKDTNRPQLQTALDYLRDGDALVVTKPDRLARSTADLLRLAEAIQTKGATLVVLSMGGQAMDTSTPTGTLMLTMLAAVAEFERALMLERQREGIAAAKEAGRYKGRPATVMARADMIRKLRSQGCSALEIARKFGIARSGVYRALKNMEKYEMSNKSESVYGESNSPEWEVNNSKNGDISDHWKFSDGEAILLRETENGPVCLRTFNPIGATRSDYEAITKNFSHYHTDALQKLLEG